MNHQTSSIPQIAYQTPQASTQPMTKLPFVDSGLSVLVFSLGDDPIASIARPRNAAWFKDKAMLAEAQEAGQILDEEQLAFLTDPRILDVVLMANISNYGSDVISEVPHSETYLNDIENQSVHAMQDFEQSQASVQDTDLQAQQDSIILSVIEKMSEQMINHVNNWEKANKGQNHESVIKICLTQKSLSGRIKPTLYDGIVISDKHVAMHVIDDEETLILEEVSRSKMSEKEKDPEAINQTISYKPIDYVKLNQLSKDFGKCFVPQQELLVEQAFWYDMSNPSTESSDASPVKMEAPKELHKVSLVNESFKSLNSTLPSLTKCMFDKDLLNEIMKVQTVFDQMEAAVQQYVLLTVMNSMSLNGESVNVEMQRSESCEKCFNLDVELSKTQNAHNDLLKSYSQLEKHCISLELSIQLNEEIFQKDKPCDNQNALEIPEYFENNDLKAQL
ncbi:hypothetical protein Tco_0007796 [Tanacetum coccineum]